MDISTLIANIASIMSYFVPGYVFISVRCFIQFRKHPTDELLISAIALSFIFRLMVALVAGIFKVTPSENAIMIYSIVLAIILAYVISLIVQKKRFSKLLLKLKIPRTANTSIWSDVVEPNCTFRILLEDCVVCGKYKYGEENREKPYIVLEKYKILEKNEPHEVKCDYSDDKFRVFMVSTSDIKHIEITYKESSSE